MCARARVCVCARARSCVYARTQMCTRARHKITGLSFLYSISVILDINKWEFSKIVTSHPAMFETGVTAPNYIEVKRTRCQTEREYLLPDSFQKRLSGCSPHLSKWEDLGSSE